MRYLTTRVQRSSSTAWGLLATLAMGMLLMATAWSHAAQAVRNPYLAPEGLSPQALVGYIQKMQSKPESIRNREGFIEAIVEACERVLDLEPTDEQREVAAITLFDTLHYHAVRGDDDSDDKLMAWAKKLENAKPEAVAKRAHLHLFELRAMQADNLEAAELAQLISDLKEYFSTEELGEVHLRLASTTVGIINDLEDKELANQLFDTFGEMLAKSEDPKTAKYGKSLLKKPGVDTDALVGKEVEVEGTTLAGEKFDWKSYRGKVVLIDFWATWCGPCRAELPNVKEVYEKYHEQGFDVVGVSVDTDREALDEYILQEAIPWVNLYDEAGPKQPIVAKFGVKGIPTAILVDKDGKVVSTSARGAKLSTLVADLCGDGSKKEQDEPEKSE